MCLSVSALGVEKKFAIAQPDCVVTVGERIGELLRGQRKTQKDLARESGVHEQTVSRIVNGKMQASVEVLSRIAAALKIDTVALLSDPNADAEPISGTIAAHSSLTGTLSTIRDAPRVSVGPLVVVDPSPAERGMPVIGTATAGYGGIGDPTGETVPIPEYLLGEQSYLLQARGDSMIDEGIRDGDFLIVDRIDVPRHGTLVVAWLNDSLVVKRWYRRQGRKVLESANPAMGWQPREITADDVFEVQGIVRHVVSRPRT